MTARVIRTESELDALLARAFGEGEPVVVRDAGHRIWIITEDDRGDAWAWSWREEDEEGDPVRAGTLSLPLTVLHDPTAEQVGGDEGLLWVEGPLASMAEQWHAASDHAADGEPFGGPVCNCERIAERARALGWGPDEEHDREVAARALEEASEQEAPAANEARRRLRARAARVRAGEVG
ncbi:MAG: hypothetical protein ACO1ON_12925 [Nocardioides sp.]